MSSIYTIHQIIITRGDWNLVRVRNQEEVFVVAGNWPCELVNGQRFRGKIVESARGRSLKNITHVNADENAFRKILYMQDVNRKQADALLKNGVKKLLRALESGDPRALKRWKGVGKSTAAAALECYSAFKDTFSFRTRWYEKFPTLEEKHIPDFDAIMKASAPEQWEEPYLTLLRSPVFWDNSDVEISTRTKFAKIIAHDSGIGTENNWYQRFERASATLNKLKKTGSTWIRCSEDTLTTHPDDPYTIIDSRCTLKKYERAEKQVAATITSLMCQDIPEQKIDPIEQLDEHQNEAVHMAMHNPVSILCGGAGVGKTSTVVHIIEKFEGEGEVLVCAPTGKAAARLIDLGVPAKTLHAAAFSKDIEEYTHLVLDEQSMQDVTFLASFLRRAKNIEHILFVGDPFQLPSVAPGALLRDLLRCSDIPRVRLNKIYRQNGGSIVRNANLIRRGNISITQDASFCVKHYNIQDVVRQFMTLWDIQNPPVIITALNRTVATLNHFIHAQFHKTGPFIPVRFYGYAKQWNIYIGDRMMNMVNMRTDDAYVANGTIGTVSGFTKERYVIMRFGESTVTYTEPQKSLRPCYAITVHKSQGSEYDNVLCVVEPTQLMHRRTLYTAITRAKKTCTVYETPNAMRKAIREQAPERTTMLTECINTCYSQRIASPPQRSPQPTLLTTTPAAPRKELVNTRKRSGSLLSGSTAKRRLIFNEPMENSVTSKENR